MNEILYSACIQPAAVQSAEHRKYFSDRANHDERTSYSVFQEDATGSKPTGSKLKLNPSKTEFIPTGIKLQRDKILNNFLCLILGQDTNPSSSANNLGVVFDSSLNFRKHISRACRACFFHISDLRRIRKKIVLRSCQGTGQ